MESLNTYLLLLNICPRLIFCKQRLEETLNAKRNPFHASNLKKQQICMCVYVSVFFCFVESKVKKFPLDLCYFIVITIPLINNAQHFFNSI